MSSGMRFFDLIISLLRSSSVMAGVQMTLMPNAMIGITLMDWLPPGAILHLGITIIMGTIHAGNDILPQKNPPSWHCTN